MTDYASAKQAYTSSSVMTAPPQKLVVMLYDGAIRFLRQSATAMRTGNREVTVNRLNRAGAIIDELNISLDMNQGEVASNLRSIYLFARRHMTEALIEQDPEKLEAVARLLADLREAWPRSPTSACRLPATRPLRSRRWRGSRDTRSSSSSPSVRAP
jgi:flagellar secretion chaperone FliS